MVKNGAELRLGVCVRLLTRRSGRANAYTSTLGLAAVITVLHLARFSQREVRGSDRRSLDRGGDSGKLSPAVGPPRQREGLDGRTCTSQDGPFRYMNAHPFVQNGKKIVQCPDTCVVRPKVPPAAPIATPPSCNVATTHL